MRRIFIYFLLALIAGSAAVALIQTEPGYVLVSYAHYTLETSLWVGLAAILVTVLVLYFLVVLINRILSSPGSLSNWLGTQQSRQSNRLTTRGLISYTEGNWSRARQQLINGAKASETPMLNYLLAARSSYQMGDLDSASKYLGTAAELAPGAGLVAELTRAQLHVEAGRYQQAVESLEPLSDKLTRHPRGLSLLQRCYEELEQWDRLALLLPELRRHKVLDDGILLELERTVSFKRLAACLEEPGAKSVEQVNNVWQSLPGGLKKDADFVVAYVGALMELGDLAAADTVATRYLKNNWTPALVRLYGLMDLEVSDKRMAQGQKWLKQHPDDAQLLLCLGRMSARRGDWQQAREYFEQSHARDTSQEASAELGRLLLHLGEDRASNRYLQEALNLSLTGLPPLPVPEEPGADTSADTP